MEIIIALENRIDQLLARLKVLEGENKDLKEQLEAARQNKDAVTSKIDQLLKKIQEESL